MSEFKFACPVCGQHMMCDTSHGGSVMECPTCFQKIVAPQAPAPDAKFILTGSKYVEPKIHAGHASAAHFKTPGGKAMPIWAFILIVVLLAGAASYFFSGSFARLISRGNWQASDVGPVGAAGSFSRANGVFTIFGSGADTWGRGDGFQYVYQPQQGDGTLTAHVLKIEDTDVWAKAGVMFRESTNTNSQFALAAIRPDGQAQFVWRNGTGKVAASSGLAGGTGHPKWLKIVRNGNSFAAFCKVNAGDKWLPVGSPQTIKMTPKALVGLVVCAHRAGVLCRAEFDQVVLQAGSQKDGK